MPLREKVSAITRIDKNLIPSSYQILGKVMLMKFFKIKSEDEKKKVAEAVMKLMPHVRTVCETTGVKDEFRMPVVKKLAGNGTVTVHKEYGLRYKLDAAKIMFSKGNHFERRRLLKEVRMDETVLDMFSGVGYFSLALAKKCKKLIAIEKNPVAFSYLKENIKLNNITNIEAILGDNRSVSVPNKVDRVIMGYFPGTEKFLTSAVKFLKKKGVIHYHNVYPKHELWQKPEEDVAKYVENFKIIGKKEVKTTGPSLYHVVLDIEVRK